MLKVVCNNKEGGREGGKRSQYVLDHAWQSRFVCLLLGRTGNILKSKTTVKLKEKKNLDRLGPRPITNNCHLLGPPFFLITDYL